MSIRSVDFLRNMCRTCMSSISDAGKTNKQCIDEVPTGSEKDGTNIMDLLQLVQPQIKVHLNDDLPKLICSACIKKLQVTFRFLEMYKDVDAKFRKMVKEAEIIDDTNNYMKLLNEPLEYIEENDLNEVLWGELNESHEMTKFEKEMEKINNGELDYENVNEWPEFEEEPIPEKSDDDVDNFDLSYNSYSDASDNECSPNNISQNQTQRKTSPKKRTTEFEIIAGENTCEDNFVKNSKQQISKNREQIEENMPSQNADGTLTCQECDAVLESVKLLKKHMRQHRLAKLPKKKWKKKKKEYKCEHCGKECLKSTAYQNHVRTHTGEEPFLCMVCGKSFNVLSSLNTHMLRHKGEKSVQCPKCPKKFICYSGLYAHMMVHTKVKPFVCDICGSAFHMAAHLRKHNLYHNNIKNYQCEYCDMRFVTGEKQRRHMRTHTGEKPYRCKYCDRAFAQSNDCIKHLRQHLGDNVYLCELCPLRFPLARDLRAHFASHIDDDEETRSLNLKARTEEERNLQIKLGAPDEKI